jgi:hypothetical protein
MAVRPHVPWYWWWLTIAGAAVALAILAWGALHFTGALDRVAPNDVERLIATLQQDLKRQEAELTTLRVKAAQSEGQLQIERSAAADLARQVKSLSFDNAALREDLAFFQSLMSSAGGREGAITVNRFRLRPEALAGEYRYQMLLVQTGQRVKEFEGSVQFVLNVQHEGKSLVLLLPSHSDRDADDYELNFKFFQRVEGTFRLAPGTAVKAMQVRVFEKGSRTPKLTHALNIS